MQIAPITPRKIIGLLLFSIGICFLLSGGYLLYKKISSTQANTSNINQAKPTLYGWLLMTGLASLVAGSYFFRAHKSNLPSITLDFRDNKNQQPFVK